MSRECSYYLSCTLHLHLLNDYSGLRRRDHIVLTIFHCLYIERSSSIFFLFRAQMLQTFLRPRLFQIQADGKLRWLPWSSIHDHILSPTLHRKVLLLCPGRIHFHRPTEHLWDHETLSKRPKWNIEFHAFSYRITATISHRLIFVQKASFFSGQGGGGVILGGRVAIQKWFGLFLEGILRLENEWC